MTEILTSFIDREAVRTRETLPEREILMLLPIPCCVHRPNGFISFQNDCFTKIFGQTNFHKFDSDYLSKLVPGCAVQRRREYFDNNGRIQIFDWLDNPRFNSFGHLTHIVSSATDVTEKEKLRQTSYIDELTGLYNRCFLDKEIARLDSENANYSIVYCDINSLKETNDNIGHEAGDNLIKQASTVLKNSCRADDIIARVGGDEFVVVLLNSNIEIARLIKSRIRQNSYQSYISMAVGISLKKDDESFQQVCRRADQAMYRHKRIQKRNQK